MTLAEYESSLLTMPGYKRGQAAGPAYALRQLLITVPSFTEARDAIVSQRQHYTRLKTTGQLETFAALSGP